MKTKRDIYCEYGFWEAFFETESQIIIDRTKRRLWDAFFVFLSSNNLFFDIPNQSVNSQTSGGKYLNELWQTKGGAGILFIPKEFPKIENISDNDDERLNSVFLTMETTTVCKQLSERKGVIVLNLDMIFTAKHIFNDNGTSFYKSNGQNWTFLWNLKEKCPSICHCNSLVIADRYLLSDKNVNAFDSNLRPIFNAILPQQLDCGIIFTISILAENLSASINDKLLRLENLVKELRPLLNFSLNIFDTNKIHDRSILTNNIILTSGAGFDVIGNNAQPLKFTTTSLRFPFLQNETNGSTTYLDWIYNLLKVEKKCRLYNHNYFGSIIPRSHLLDCYREEPVRAVSKIRVNDAFSDLFRNASSRY